MDNIDEFIKYAISNEVEYSDDFWLNVEKIMENEGSKKKFIESFNILSITFGKDNIMAVVGFINDIVTSLGINLPELYQTILSLMYKDFSYDYSLSYRFAELLINIKEGNREVVFEDIVKLMKEDDVLSIRISVCALYGNFELDEIRKSLVVNYLEKIYNCLNLNLNDKYLKRDINNFLLNKLKNSCFNSFISRYEALSTNIS